MCETEVKKMSEQEVETFKENIAKQKDRIQAIRDLVGFLVRENGQASCYIGVGTSTKHTHIHLLAFESLVLGEKPASENGRSDFLQKLFALLLEEEKRMCADFEKINNQLKEQEQLVGN